MLPFSAENGLLKAILRALFESKRFSDKALWRSDPRILRPGTVYANTYVALAIAESCPLITTDRKLVNLLAQTPLTPTTVWIEDLA